MSDDWWQRMLDIHVTVPFRVVRAAAPHPREPRQGRARARRGGLPQDRQRVVGLGHDGQRGPGQLLGRQECGRRTHGKTLASEWGQFKINVNAVAFGYIETRLTASKDEANTMEIGGEKVQLGIPTSCADGLDAHPARKAGHAREAAGGVFFLCSPGATTSTGRCSTSPVASSPG